MATMTKDTDPPGTILSRFINPGEFFFHDANCQIHTLLGSCVAITLWHSKLHVGGMCHFVLPDRTGSFREHSDRALNTDSSMDGRYADGAMALFEREVRRRDTKLTDYHAKIFGGSRMMVGTRLSEHEQIGTRNIGAALKHLADRGIPVMSAHIGETGHRRVVFDVWSGDVWVNYEPGN